MPRHAAALSGTELYTLCSAPAGSTKEVACISYVRGLLDGIDIGAGVPEFTARYCPPNGGIETTQARLIIEKQMKDHPELLNRHAVVIAASALQEAFPCAEQKNPQ
jgi:hypothetical protein